jgi:hypothetical protein
MEHAPGAEGQEASRMTFPQREREGGLRGAFRFKNDRDTALWTNRTGKIVRASGE